METNKNVTGKPQAGIGDDVTARTVIVCLRRNAV